MQSLFGGRIVHDCSNYIWFVIAANYIDVKTTNLSNCDLLTEPF